jgi:hypothetical protein
MSEWWQQPYEGGKMVDLPGFPRGMYPPDGEARGKTPSSGGADVIAYKRTVARLGRWDWDPDGWDDAYSNVFAHGQEGGDVGGSGIAGVQRQAKLEPTGWVDEQTFNLLRSVKVPAGLPHAGDYAMDAVARQLLVDAWEARERRAAASAGSPVDVSITASPGEPHWGGSGDVMAQFIEPFMVRRGVPIGSGKRTPEENAACGGSSTSDHLTTKTTTAARDFKTFAGEDDARALAVALGIEGWQPNSYANHTFTAGGRTFRAQILWGAGIDHGDHVHVGVSPA